MLNLFYYNVKILAYLLMIKFVSYVCLAASGWLVTSGAIGYSAQSQFGLVSAIVCCEINVLPFAGTRRLLVSLMWVKLLHWRASLRNSMLLM